MNSDSFHFLGRRKFLLSCAMGLVGLSSTHLFLSWWQESHGKILDYSHLTSSGFPTGGSANPTLTITQLALRLADHLKQII